ncbi:Cfr10I/Bse634I family restriction endonuclease [Arthrobacter sp. 92]|uniref:Cfr10I/Bse634I family restriction endonuclease n=1 Tax=Arthrobacter sp. 92 TaxID=3418175 RepID=UPI003D070577
MPFIEVVAQCIENASSEGKLLYGNDFEIKGNATAKVAGDVYEVLTSGILWDAAAHWNRYMIGGPWVSSPRYAKPTVVADPSRQIAVLNLPRRYDWVRLLVPEARQVITDLRTQLAGKGLTMPTSTPDIAVIVLPDEVHEDELWRTPVGNLNASAQQTLSRAYQKVEGQVEPGEIILAMALKSSLRSDRIYQPLYEANVMQLLLEGHLDAPKVEFEVHVLNAEGTDSGRIYQAASLHSAFTDQAHRAVRELYVPATAAHIVTRFYGFLNGRTAVVPPDDPSPPVLPGTDKFGTATLVGL